MPFELLYLVVALGMVGAVVLICARRRVPPEPRCPTCRQPLEALDVERCPNCLLWHPVDASASSYRWQRERLLIGALLIALPAALYLLVPIITSYTFLPPPPKPQPAFPIPLGSNVLSQMTPAQLQQLQALGYIQATPQGVVIQPMTTSAAAGLPSDVRTILNSLGYIKDGEQSEQPDDGAGKTAESAPP